MIKRGRDFLKIYGDESANYKVLGSSDPKVQIKAVHVDGDSLVAGVAAAVIDADAATCLAYEFTKDSREVSSMRKAKGIVEAAVKKLNEHCHLYLSIRDLRVPGLADREWRMKMVWERCDDGTYFLTYEDTNELDNEFPVENGNVVASSRAAYLFEPLPKVGNIPQTRVTFVARVDIQFNISSFIMNRLILGTGKNVSLLRKRFDRSEEIDAESRTCISHMIKTQKYSDDGTHYAPNFVERNGKVIHAALVSVRRLHNFLNKHFWSIV